MSFMSNNVIKLMICSIALVCMGNSAGYAQSFFGFGSQQTTTTPSPVPAPPQGPPKSNILSPEEFKNAVNAQGQQNLNDLSQQFNAQLKKSPAPVPAAPIKPGATPPAASENAANPPPITQPPGSTENPVTSAAPQPAAAPAASSTYSIKPSAPTPAIGTQAPAAAPQKSQIYTGFVGVGNTNGNTNSSTSNSSSGSSGGWNIKY
jgi:hypothetical protein